VCVFSVSTVSSETASRQAGKTTTKNRHTQETKGTNEHDKKEQKKKGTAISLKNKY
jgi:hypothetical protein